MAQQIKNVWDELRKPFDPKVMGLLPKISCYNCSNAQGKVCAQHSKQKCTQCQAYISTAHIHLDFVGHAAVTDRLNNVVGPENWNWSPIAFGDDGLPRLDGKGNLWITLTINNISRLGYGDGSQSVKELIGDALRNAAMRFGIALDLWSKDELESTLDAPEMKNQRLSTTKPAIGSAADQQPPKTRDADQATKRQLDTLTDLVAKLEIKDEEKADFFQAAIGKDHPRTFADFEKSIEHAEVFLADEVERAKELAARP